MKYTLITLALILSFSVNAKQKTKVTPLSAKSFLVADKDWQVLKEKNSDNVMPIASISKLMVSLLVTEQDMGEVLSVPEVRRVKTKIPRRVKFLTRKELLTLSLVKSDNFATQILCENLPNCVEKMNEKAIQLEMYDTEFKEPTGLDRNNVSTASDLLKLLFATHDNAIITTLSSMPLAEISTDKRPIRVTNTNPLVWKFDILLSKTGFTRPAGGCVVFIVNSSEGQKAVIILGSRNMRARISDAERLLKGL